jgi:hypothetical protein
LRRDGDVKWGAFLQSLNTCFIQISPEELHNLIMSLNTRLVRAPAVHTTHLSRSLSTDLLVPCQPMSPTYCTHSLRKAETRSVIPETSSSVQNLTWNNLSSTFDRYGTADAVAVFDSSSTNTALSLVRSRRKDKTPRLKGPNRYGRAGCQRCSQCRNWRQKVFFCGSKNL